MTFKYKEASELAKGHAKSGMNGEGEVPVATHRTTGDLGWPNSKISVSEGV